jgi:hypothetical protein
LDPKISNFWIIVIELVKVYKRHGCRGDFNWGVIELWRIFNFNLKILISIGINVFWILIKRQITDNFSVYYIISLRLLNLNQKENIIQKKLLKN